MPLRSRGKFWKLTYRKKGHITNVDHALPQIFNAQAMKNTSFHNFENIILRYNPQ